MAWSPWSVDHRSEQFAGSLLLSGSDGTQYESGREILITTLPRERPSLR